VKAVVFPVLGAVFVFLVLVPVLTLVCKGLLVLRRRHLAEPGAYGTTATFMLIVAPVLGPLAWFTSAGLHHAEPGDALLGCLNGVVADEWCVGAIAFAGVQLLLLAVACGRKVYKPSFPRHGVAEDARHAQRLHRICASHHGLRGAAQRVTACAHLGEPIATWGLWAPRIAVSPNLLDALDDDALAAALLHEVAHARNRDPLRYLVAFVALSLNPLAGLLRSEFARWRFTRELACDAEAVHQGAKPASLAHAIVQAARSAGGAPHECAAHLAHGGLAALRARIALLLNHRPLPAAGRVTWLPTLALIAAAVGLVALPHVLDKSQLAYLHLGVEAVLTAF
jgi:beta-lactamase regulating signal transducer with metallopeptidase domain